MAESPAAAPPTKRAKAGGGTPTPTKIQICPIGRQMVCPALRKSIDRWSLLPPYADSTNEDLWAPYYAERSALEFRHKHFFFPDDGDDGDDDGDEKKENTNAGKALPTYKSCHGWGPKCKGGATLAEVGTLVEGEEGQLWGVPNRCSGCKGVAKSSIYHGCVETTDEVKEAWAKLVADDEILKAVYDEESGLATCPPLMKPPCRESYATDCHHSGTERGEYEDYHARMCERMVDTLKGTTLEKDQAKALAKTTAAGLYILSYWANFEESSIDAAVRTVEFGTRLYSPIGNGRSIDLHWYHHYRQRMTIAPEKYSNLFAEARTLEECDPTRPDHTWLNWRNKSTGDALALLDGDTDEDHVRKKFAKMPEINQYRKVLFGEGDDLATKISGRKVFGLLARAAGAHVVRNEGGWVYAGMRKRYELFPGEESDGEEDGEENGPGCIIS